VVVTVSSGFLLMAEVSTGHCFAIAFTSRTLPRLFSESPDSCGCRRGVARPRSR
jgi:hypothetical protein